MSRRRALVLQTDIVRSLKAVLASGVEKDRITGVKITPEGGILVLMGTPSQDRAAGPANEWDEVLKP